MPFADNGGCRIYWRLQGADGAPVIALLNSIGTDQSIYDGVAPLLVDDFRLLRIDLRGHGASDAPSGDYDLATLARDVEAVMAAAGVDSAAVCGVSLGGMVAMALALHAPARVDALIPACTSAAMDAGFWGQRIATVRAQGMAAVADAAVGRVFSEEYARTHRAVLDGARRTMLTMSADGYAGCGAAIRDMALLGDLPQIAVPTLVIGGAQDLATPFAGHGDRIAAAIPAARAMLLPTGHLAPVEDAAGFAGAVRDFLRNAGRMAWSSR